MPAAKVWRVGFPSLDNRQISAYAGVLTSNTQSFFLGATASCIITARVCVCSNTSDLLLP